MSEIAGIALASPWVLAALAVLPVIWWLLRVTPPSPKRILFPAVRLLFGLRHEEETPARTPPWLLALRLAIAALIIVGLAGPLYNSTARIDGSGPLVIVVDDGWAAARRWDRRREALGDALQAAERAERPVVLMTTAPGGADGTTSPSGLMSAADARALALAITPKPWPVDRAAAARKLAGLELGNNVDILWLADGIDDGAAAAFADTLGALGRLRVMTDPGLDAARVVLPPKAEPGSLTFRVFRANSGGAESLWLRASDENGALLAREPVDFTADSRSAEVTLSAPAELRNRIVRVELEGEQSAAAVVLLDERWRRRPVGLASARTTESSQPLLSELYYLDRALQPVGEVRTGELGELLKRPLAVLVLADVSRVVGPDRAAVEDWLEKGGVLIRFAGPLLAEGTDDLVPVRLRTGGRVLGGALSWSQPATLAPFDEHSPFAGLRVPPDVRIFRQVLAEPSLDLADKTWATLADGTPLVTAERRGRGWLVLVHTTADPSWSNLALSGLFVGMLQRVVGLSRGVVGAEGGGMLDPLRTLDGYGHMVEPPGTSRAIAEDGFAEATPGPRHPPGLYGEGGTRRALNLSPAIGEPRLLPAMPAAFEMATYGESGETDLKPWLLAAALLLALTDLVISLVLRGLLPVRASAAGIALLLLSGIPAHAQETDDDYVLAATLETRLAYVKTGESQLDAVSRAGLIGLGETLAARTSIEPAEPMAVDVERDELIFFPLIYWPVSTFQQPLSETALARVDHYLKTGGIILFDTRDQNALYSRQIGGVGPGAQRLRTLLQGLNVPPLQSVPPDHVLTRSFYLMQDFPGRWTGGQLWVERHEGGVNDGVSSLIIGSNDWAAAWAIDDRRRPMFAVVPGGERQREQAFRFGVNLVMYAMTGNYKADQVHLPAILERLGQ